MFALALNVVIFLAAAGSGSESGFVQWWNKWLNYPGFEIWKFVNLFIFVGLLGYILKKPLSEAFKAKREVIRAELIRAEEAKQAALAKLTDVEAKLAGVESETEAIMFEAREEIEHERSRLTAQAETEAGKIREQAEGEVVRIGQVAKLELRRFGAEESIRRAEEKLRAKVNAGTDAQLIDSGIRAIGGLN